MRKKYFGLLLALSIISGLLPSVFIENVNALDYVASGSVCPTHGYLQGTENVTLPVLTITASECSIHGYSANVNLGYLRNLTVGFNNQSIPANSIFTIAGRFKASGVYPPFYLNANSIYFSNLGTTFGDYGSFVSTFYVDTQLNNEVNFKVALEGIINTEVDIIISGISYTTLATPPSAQQLTNLGNLLRESNTNTANIAARILALTPTIDTIHDNSNTIVELLGDLNDNLAQSVTADGEMNRKDNEDRENIEEQQEDNQDSADQAGSEATSTGTSLFSAFTQLLGALTNISGNDCRLPSIQVYSLNLGSMDLCTYTIPPQIMALVSIGMVFIIVPLGIHLVKKMIALYKEITG